MARGSRRRPPGATRPPRLVAVLVAAASVALACGATRARAGDVAPGGALDLQGAAALVVMTNDGLAPASLRVPPGTPLVWLNRAPQSALAISFDDAFRDSLEGCAERRGFHAVPGHGPFSLMLVPGTVAALCAPSTPGLYPYAVHGERSFEGVVEVLDVEGGAQERDAP